MKSETSFSGAKVAFYLKRFIKSITRGLRNKCRNDKFLCTKAAQICNCKIKEKWLQNIKQKVEKETGLEKNLIKLKYLFFKRIIYF